MPRTPSSLPPAPRRPTTPAVVAAALAALLALAAGAVPAVAAPAGPDPGPEPRPPAAVTYEAPVHATVRDPFRPPATRYGRGNRGLEYDTAPGQPVRAAAAGMVTFAGPVAGRRYVTILHADGVRTTVGPLAAIAATVRPGAAVGAGDVLGSAGRQVLWTARLGTAYVDPAVLLEASGAVRVHLVPDRRRPPRRPLRAGPSGPLGPR